MSRRKNREKGDLSKFRIVNSGSSIAEISYFSDIFMPSFKTFPVN